MGIFQVEQWLMLVLRKINGTAVFAYRLFILMFQSCVTRRIIFYPRALHEASFPP